MIFLGDELNNHKNLKELEHLGAQQQLAKELFLVRSKGEKRTTVEPTVEFSSLSGTGGTRGGLRAAERRRSAKRELLVRCKNDESRTRIIRTLTGFINAKNTGS